MRSIIFMLFAFYQFAFAADAMNGDDNDAQAPHMITFRVSDSEHKIAQNKRQRGYFDGNNAARKRQRVENKDEFSTLEKLFSPIKNQMLDSIEFDDAEVNDIRTDDVDFSKGLLSFFDPVRPCDLVITNADDKAYQELADDFINYASKAKNPVDFLAKATFFVHENIERFLKLGYCLKATSAFSQRIGSIVEVTGEAVNAVLKTPNQGADVEPNTAVCRHFVIITLPFLSKVLRSRNSPFKGTIRYNYGSNLDAKYRNVKFAHAWADVEFFGVAPTEKNWFLDIYNRAFINMSSRKLNEFVAHTASVERKSVYLISLDRLPMLKTCVELTLRTRLKENPPAKRKLNYQDTDDEQLRFHAQNFLGNYDFELPVAYPGH